MKTKRFLKVSAARGALALAAFGATAFFLGATVTPLTATAQAPRLISPPVAADGTLSFADLVERVAPAVVSVMTERQVPQVRLPDPFSEFFDYRFGGERNNGAQRSMQAEGSGFFVDGNGHIVTNNHVVQDAQKISVRLSDGKELPATLVGVDPLTDLAVLKVDAPRGQPFVKFAEGVDVRVGDWVIAVGNPFGLGGSVTSGIVSAIGGESRQGQFLDYIQIDAPINRGNSGGPTFDLKGRVVGVNTAIYSPNGGSVGIGFAIPAKTAREAVDQLIRDGAVTRGWLGVSLQSLTTDLAAALGRKDQKGALVAEVLPETPAAAAGFASGDLIVAIEGKPVNDSVDLTRVVSATAPGRKIKVEVVREGKPKVLNVTVGERDRNEGVTRAPAAARPGGDDALSSEIGLRVADINETLRMQFRLPQGVTGVLVTSVAPGSAADRAGLQPGMVILQADGQPLTSAAALRSRVADARKAGKDALLLRLQVGEARQFAALPLTAQK